MMTSAKADAKSFLELEKRNSLIFFDRCCHMLNVYATATGERAGLCNPFKVTMEKLAILMDKLLHSRLQKLPAPTCAFHLRNFFLRFPE